MTEFVEGQQQAEETAQIGAEDHAVAATGAEAQTEADPFEEVAREHGWTPKEEWRGNPDDWRDPRAFVAYGMKRSRESAEEMKSLRSDMKGIARTAQALQQRAVEEARREAEERFAGAVERKDYEEARSAREELSRIEQTHQVDQQAALKAEVDAFRSRNPWFDADPAARELAARVTNNLAQQGVGVADQLAQAEQVVRSTMPHLFGAQRPASKAPATVSAPQSRAAQPGARTKGFADLPANAQVEGRKFLNMGMVKTLEDYAKVYHEENA